MGLINLTLYRNFYKRHNSTKQPPSSVIKLNIAGHFVDNTSLLNPQIRFTDLTDVAWRYTYANIPLFGGRFYFIKDWTYTKEGWIATMEVDVLATYREQIANSRQYLVRSSTRRNPDIPDTYFPPTDLTYTVDKEPYTDTGVEVQAWETASFDRGCYVICLTGRGGADTPYTVGTQTYFLFTPQQFQDFLYVFFQDPNWIDDGAAGITKGLIQMIVNPSDYICSCRWFPFDASIVSSSNTENIIKVGWWALFTSCRQVTDAVCDGRIYKMRNMYCDIPKHPLANANTAYLKYSPYSTYTLHFPPFADVQIPDYAIRNCSRILIQTQVDVTSGVGCLKVFAGSSYSIELDRQYAKIGVNIPLSQSAAIDLEKAVSAGASVVGALAAPTGAAALASAGIGAANVLQNPGRKSAGETNGTFLNLTEIPKLRCVFYYTANPDNSKFGSPACMDAVIRQPISTGGNYEQTVNAYVDIDATDTERSTMTALMDGGFYYE